MFLQSLSECCADLDRGSASLAYSTALERVRGAAEHTNTMMWVGAMADCPHDLTNLGQLLKHGKVDTRERKDSFRWGLGQQALGQHSMTKEFKSFKLFCHLVLTRDTKWENIQSFKTKELLSQNTKRIAAGESGCGIRNQRRGEASICFCSNRASFCAAPSSQTGAQRASPAPAPVVDRILHFLVASGLAVAKLNFCSKGCQN